MTASAIHHSDTAADIDRLGAVRVWLYAMAALVLLMVIVGGATRLTGSGLSITTWKPISGIVPPLTPADWLAEFAAYQQIPQFTAENSWMGIEDFKAIFWWEWIHRFLGRFLGLAFAVPFLIFLIQKRFTLRLAAPLAGLFLLGGFQGLLGWWMVSSGLSELTSVSQYRLAAHLFAAALLFLALLWVARRLRPLASARRAAADWQASAWLGSPLLALLLLQIVAGAFVAGLDAGMGYNTWPLMDNALIPTGLDAMQPLWRNLFENALTVQFVHRLIAYGIVAYVAVLLWRQASRGFAGAEVWLPRIGLLVLLQVGLGIATLLSMVPLALALLHQALALLLVGAAVLYLADLVPVSGAEKDRAVSV